MQAKQQTKEKEENERPLFVKSLNFRHSTKMDPKNFQEPPTEKQVRYIKNLGYDGEFPKTRKQASDIIGKLLGSGATTEIKCQNCGNLTKSTNSINGKFCFKPECRTEAGKN